jgi:ornithine cyclodeaminase/alanine dehydrogenase-like protein (mu-crystallin family)
MPQGVNHVPITILTEAELRRCVELDAEVIDAVADAFTALAAGRVVMPPVLHMDLPEAHGEVDVKTAYVSGLPSFALKVSPGFFDNPSLGLPSVSGMMMLLSATTGRLEALHLDNGYLTDVRTAAAGAVAARHLAQADARVAGVIGAGVQARLQIEALAKVRPIERMLERADLLVCDARAQCALLGELHHALEQGIELTTTELGEITGGARPGRTADDQITVCDLTGTGVQDTAIALLAWRKAAAQGLGVTIDN